MGTGSRDRSIRSEHLYSRLAEIYQSQGEYSKAAEYLQKYVIFHPEDASAHYRLGLLLTLSDPDRASAELISASQLKPELDPAAQTLRTALNLASINHLDFGAFRDHRPRAGIG